MKTNTINRWKAITVQLNKLITAKGNKQTPVLGYRALKKGLEKYSPWSQIGYRNLSFLENELEVRTVNVRLLEQFVEHVLRKNTFYKNFISSHLQLGSDDQQSAAEIKRMMALKNLGHLVLTTIHEMKLIELNHIAKNQG